MPQPPLSTSIIRRLSHRCAADNFNKAQTARQLQISRSSARKYIAAFNRSSLTLPEIENVPGTKLIALLFPSSRYRTPSRRKLQLLACLPSIHARIEIDGLTMLDAWREAANQCSYKYSQFTSLYAAWRFERGLGRISRAKGKLRAFLERPRRAGNKIWGKEQVEAVFKEENNCKDPRWR